MDFKMILRLVMLEKELNESTEKLLSNARNFLLDYATPAKIRIFRDGWYLLLSNKTRSFMSVSSGQTEVKQS